NDAACTPESQLSGESVRVVECPLDIQRHSTVSPTITVVVSEPLSSSRKVRVFSGPTSTILVAASRGAATPRKPTSAPSMYGGRIAATLVSSRNTRARLWLCRRHHAAGRQGQCPDG